ncbi:MBL fold metallo-hydrolase [Candidatus Woesearchaeota archaeon]|nr:MBL fold metallo-hydrolase [Candidatus Woesearchaeota archaeon]
MANGITILGTGGDSFIVGRQTRASGGIILTTDQNQLHIDPGPGTLQQLKQHELHPRETTTILLSHQHVNHAGDAAALISAMTHNGMDKRGILISNTLDNCYVPGYQQSLTEKSIAIQPDSKVGINDIEIRAIQAKHYDSNAFSYLIQTPTYRLGYTGDTAYTEEWAKKFIGCNILLVNTKYPVAVNEGDHLNVDDAIKLVNHVKPQLAVITHFGAKMLDADPLAQARYIQRETKVQVVAAKDGLHIAPAHYDAQQKQKILGNF